MKQMKIKSRSGGHGASPRKDKNCSSSSVNVIKTAGNDYMVVVVAEVVWVMAT